MSLKNVNSLQKFQDFIGDNPKMEYIHGKGRKFKNSYSHNQISYRFKNCIPKNPTKSDLLLIKNIKTHLYNLDKQSKQSLASLAKKAKVSSPTLAYAKFRQKLGNCWFKLTTGFDRKKFLSPASIDPIAKLSKTEAYKKAARLISDADVLFISAGAGMGVPGGLGTFRGKAAGVWPPLEKLKLQFQDMSNPARFKEDDKYGPNWAWSFWKWRYTAYTGSEPHEGYQQLLDWSNMKKKPTFVFTTNIDDHFLKAGFDRVLEHHGTVKYLQCSREDSTCPDYDKMWLPEKNLIENLQVDPATDQITSPLPTCNGCKKVARPTVLMFGDGKVLRTRIDKQTKDYNHWKKEINKSGKLKMVAIEIGAGVAIPTARRESEKISKEFSCPLIRINPEHPEVSNAADRVEHISISEGAEEALKQINKEIRALNQ